MTTVSRSAFIRQNVLARLSVDDLAGAHRLRGVDVAAADRDNDGVIAGAFEAGALWEELCGHDVVETTQQRRPLPFLPPKTTTTAEGERLAAVESFRVADARVRALAVRGDAFGREGLLTAGPARGEPVDTTKARPVVQLDAAAKLEACRRAGVDPATIEHAFANLSHGEGFYTALVPRGAVREVAMMIESFPAPVPAAHAMLRFTLADDQPAILVPQDRADPRTLALADLVFSAEAIGQPGWKFDLVNGQRNAFALVDRMESLENRFRHVESYTPAHPVAVHRLNVGPDVANDILREALSTSHRTGLGDRYNTLNRSCGTEAFSVLDRGIGDQVPVQVRLARAVTGERLPPLADKYLAMRGLLRAGHEPTDLRTEWTTSPRPVTPRP